jgi:hypothetical protein
MLRLSSRLCGLTVALVLAFAGTASAETTLGTTTKPSFSLTGSCGPNRVVNQVTSDPGTPYSVPESGTVTQWQTNVEGNTLSSSLTLVVLRPVGFQFKVVGVDSRSISNSTPTATVSSFPLSTPIAVAAGDTLGLYSSSSVVCYWHGGSTPNATTLAALDTMGTPAPNQTLSRAMGDSPSGYTMNLAATFVPTPTAAPTPTPAPTKKKKCKKHKKKRSAESAKKKKCKKKKKR